MEFRGMEGMEWNGMDGMEDWNGGMEAEGMEWNGMEGTYCLHVRGRQYGSAGGYCSNYLTSKISQREVDQDLTRIWRATIGFSNKALERGSSDRHVYMRNDS